MIDSQGASRQGRAESRGKSMLKYIAAAAICAVFAAPVIADEAWSSEIGDIIYERDLESGEAVLSYPFGEGDARGFAYVEGLAGKYEGRGAFTGVWIESDITEGEACNVSIADPETGEARNNWGRLDIVFTEPDFPGGFVAMRGDCFEEPGSYLVAKPVIGSTSSE